MSWQVLVGLSAALLSEDRNVLRESSYRPVNLRRVMATLVVQRALKRNLMLKQGKLEMTDIVLTAQEKGGIERGQRTAAQLTGVGSLQSDYYALYSGEVGREYGSEASMVGASEESKNVLPRTGMDGNPQARGASKIGSIILPPDMGEGKWLMRRFLLDLQEANDGGEEESVVGQMGSSNDDKTCSTTEVLDSHSKETGIRYLPSREQPNGVKRGYRYFGELEAYNAAAIVNYDNTMLVESCAHCSANGDGDDYGGGARRRSWLRSSGVRPVSPESWIGSVPPTVREIRERHTPNNGADAIDGGHVVETEEAQVTRERRAKETNDTPITSLAVWLTGMRHDSRTCDENP